MRDLNLSPCIVCGSRLQNMGNPKDSSNQPLGGLAFETRGHYSSTVFDPFNGSKLHICVCDPCIIQGMNDFKTVYLEGTLDET